MKTSPALLAPLLRSDAQGRLLAELYLNPEREWTATELARVVSTSVPSASRELGRLVEAGYARLRPSGRNRYVQVNRDHPLYPPLAQMLRYAYGPVAVLPGHLRQVPGVDKAYVYGSWAARLAGEPGPDPRDIDVLAIGDDVDLEALSVAADHARRELGREVNARAVTHAAWDAGEDVFLKHVHDRPLVPLPL